MFLVPFAKRHLRRYKKGTDATQSGAAGGTLLSSGECCNYNGPMHATSLFAGEVEKGREKGYPEKMAHPTFMPAVSQGSLGKVFLPLPEKQTRQSHSKPCLQLHSGPSEGALEGCSNISFGARSASESCPSLPKRTLRTPNASFPVLVALDLLRLCSSPVHCPSSPLPHHPALTPRKLRGPPSKPLLARFTALHSTAPLASQKTGISLSFQALPMRRTATLGADQEALRWLG